MKVVNETKSDVLVEVCTIKMGDCFYYDEKLFMVTDNDDDMCNTIPAVDLSSGESAFMNRKEFVVSVPNVRCVFSLDEK